MKSAPRSCTIAPDRLGLESESHRGGRHALELSPDLGEAVRAAARRFRTTPFAVFAAVMAVLLRQFGDNDDVIFGTPVSLRGRAAVDRMIGCLTNLHPLRLTVSADLSFRALVNAAKAEVLGAMEHRAIPFATIARMARQGRGLDAPPLCDAAMVVDDMRWEPFALPGLTAEAVRLPAGHVKFAVHLSLSVADDGGFVGSWTYDADVFNADTIASVAGRFVRLLKQCIAAPDEPLSTGRDATGWPWPYRG